MPRTARQAVGSGFIQATYRIVTKSNQKVTLNSEYFANSAFSGGLILAV